MRFPRALTMMGFAFAFSIGSPLAMRSALAAETEGAVSAETLFEQARVLMARGRYGEACPKLAESQRLDAGVGTLMNLADCYEKNGQLASAWTTFVGAEAAARDSKQFDREAISHERAAALKRLVPTLTIEVDSADSTGLEVKRDGVVVGAALWGAAIPIDSGSHAIEATANGRAAWHTTAVVGAKAGNTKIIIPRLARLEGTLSKQRVTGIAIASVGTLGVVIGAVFGAAAIRKKDASSAHCEDGDLCDQAGLDLRSQGLSAARVSTGLFVAGAVLVAGGVTIFALAPTHAPASASISVGLASFTLGGRL